MVNLLPERALKHAQKEYRLRLAAVSAFAVSVALVLAAALLLPTYFIMRVAQTDIISQMSLADKSLVQQDLAAAAQNVQTSALLLAAVRNQTALPRPSSVVQVLLASRTQGITIHSVDYVLNKKMGSVGLVGIAGTREELLHFKDVLLRVPGVKSVDLPVQSLAEALNVSFSLTVLYSASSTPSSPRAASSVPTGV